MSPANFITRDMVKDLFVQFGYAVDEQHDKDEIIFIHPDVPEQTISMRLLREGIYWIDLQPILEDNGINVDAALALLGP